MAFVRKTLVLLSVLASAFLTGFVPRPTGPVGTWVLIKGSILTEPCEVTLAHAEVSHGKVRTTTSTYKARMTKTISFSGLGEYVENRTGVVYVSAAEPAYKTQFGGPWDKVSYRLVDDKSLKIISEDGVPRTVRFQIDGDQLTLTKGKEVEVYQKASTGWPIGGIGWRRENPNSGNASCIGSHHG